VGAGQRFGLGLEPQQEIVMQVVGLVPFARNAVDVCAGELPIGNGDTGFFEDLAGGRGCGGSA
jgi:hypothetical protein